MSPPLADVRVLDLSRILAGPLAGQYLADLGADVVKVERPGTGDDTRGWAPPYAVEPSDGDPGLAAYYMCANRGKRSIAIDITKPEGAALVRKLAKWADVVLENFKVGGLAKYGLDYESLSAINPSLIYCSITGFGQDGPYAKRAGYDFLVQAMGGFMSVTGTPDGSPGAGPMKAGVAISDQMSGMNALTAVLAALYRRAKTGEGARIDVALLDCTVSTLANQATSYLASGVPPSRLGNAHPTVVPYEAFATQDGHIVLAVGNDGQFARFCEVAGKPDLAEDPKYLTNAARIINRAELIPQITHIMATRTSADWMTSLEQAAVPCGPINTIDHVFADPQIKHRAMRRTLEHADHGPLDVVANPIRFADHDTTNHRPPPRLGQDTVDVLRRELGYDEAQINELLQTGIIEARS
ncbi:MAG: CaiB/BaiF CoA-transferase family protein [Pseudomonadota bacterium]